MLGNNPRYVANYALYGFVFPLKVTTPNPATRGSSSSRSVHTCVRKEVRREVHVHTEVHSFVEEEVCTQSVDKDDVPEIVVLEKNVKEQQMQIADMQRRLLSLEDIIKQLNNVPSKVDHNVDNNVDHNFDHIVRDRVDLAEESESAAIDGLISLQSHDIHSQPFLSPSKVTQLINELFTSPNGPGFSQKMGDRANTCFWEDNWAEGGILKNKFPRVYALEKNKKKLWLASR
uniref:RNA-directed DNA polymerase, eukaryota, reverse transcriptase zinc-binding domain protein n=1 Tax=Tanacetum cinerariifolium TaxID=118510 RepID=A0A6L2P8G9_TANCI|nr:hypothetical protein [Tanacetum cinerariifolium]